LLNNFYLIYFLISKIFIFNKLKDKKFQKHLKNKKFIKIKVFLKKLKVANKLKNFEKLKFLIMKFYGDFYKICL